ncbi:TPA: hypothetical protein L3881_006139, partial [Pseudomonas aeruginosa]
MNSAENVRRCLLIRHLSHGEDSRLNRCPGSVDHYIPACAPDAQGRPRFQLNASEQPIPHLAYTATTFLGRVANVVIRNAPEQATLEKCYEADMAMQLVRMAVEGYGVAWLSHSAVQEEIDRGALVSAGGVEWSTTLEIRSYCSLVNPNPTMRSLWSTLVKPSLDPSM